MLRDYQQQCVEKMKWGLEIGGNSVITLPTGAGKTYVIAGFVEQTDMPVLILVPSKELLEQDLEKLEEVVDRSEIGVFSASMNEKQVKKYTIGTIQSIYKKPELFDHYSVAIIDECHLYNPKKLSGMYNKFFRAIGNPIVFGLTATPYRQDILYEYPGGWGNYQGAKWQKMQMEAITTTKMITRYKEKFWDRMLYVANTIDLQNEGFLCPLRYFDLTIIDQDQIPLNKSKSDFNLDLYEELLAGREREIIHVLSQLSKRHKSLLVFCATIKQAQRLSSVLKGSSYVDSTMNKKQREKTIDKTSDLCYKECYHDKNKQKMCVEKLQQCPNNNSKNIQQGRRDISNKNTNPKILCETQTRRDGSCEKSKTDWNEENNTSGVYDSKGSKWSLERRTCFGDGKINGEKTFKNRVSPSHQRKEIRQQTRELRTVVRGGQVWTESIRNDVPPLQTPVCDFVSCHTPKKEREQLIKDFREAGGILFNVGILTTGFNYDNLEAIALIRPTRSLNLYNQMIGRVTRIKDTGVGYVYDFSGTVKKLGRIETIQVTKNSGQWDVVSETKKGGFHLKKLYSYRIGS